MNSDEILENNKKVAMAYEKMIRYSLLSMCTHKDDAEDIAQDVMLKIITYQSAINLNSAHGFVTKCLTWCRGNHYRRSDNRRTINSTESGFLSSDENHRTQPLMTSRDISCEDVENLVFLETAYENTNQRENYFEYAKLHSEGYKLEDIAKMTGEGYAAVKSRHNQADQKNKEYYRKTAKEYERIDRKSKNPRNF